MPSKDDKIGALWMKTTRDNAEYYKGSIEIGGQRHEVVIFRNGYKEQEKHPDFIVYRSRPKEA
jgi:uncharacterized protein (DUF736 family)